MYVCCVCNRRYMGSTAILEVPRTFVDFAEHTANQGSRSPHRKRDKACAPAMLDRLTQAQVSASGSWSGAATASAWTHRGPPPACPPAFLVIWSVFKPPLPPPYCQTCVPWPWRPLASTLAPSSLVGTSRRRPSCGCAVCCAVCVCVRGVRADVRPRLARTSLRRSALSA